MPHMNRKAFIEKPEVKCTQKPSWVAGWRVTPTMVRGMARSGSATVSAASPGGALRTQPSTATTASSDAPETMRRPVRQPRPWMSGSTSATDAIWPKPAIMPVTWVRMGTRRGSNHRGRSRRTALKMQASPMPNRMRAT